MPADLSSLATQSLPRVDVVLAEKRCFALKQRARFGLCWSTTIAAGSPHTPDVAVNVFLQGQAVCAKDGLVGSQIEARPLKMQTNLGC
jgi:hypothetical protein